MKYFILFLQLFTPEHVSPGARIEKKNCAVILHAVYSNACAHFIRNLKSNSDVVIYFPDGGVDETAMIFQRLAKNSWT